MRTYTGVVWVLVFIGLLKEMKRDWSGDIIVRGNKIIGNWSDQKSKSVSPPINKNIKKKSGMQGTSPTFPACFVFFLQCQHLVIYSTLVKCYFVFKLVNNETILFYIEESGWYSIFAVESVAWKVSKVRFATFL